SGQMTHFVASSTLDSAISCVMQGAFCTKGGFPVPLLLVFLLVLSVFAMLAACAFKAVATLSATSCRMTSKVMAGVSDVDVLLRGILSTEDNTYYGMFHEDRDNDAIGGNDDERAISWKQ
ncbi:hypothetical protein Tco_0782007, partial [Tanacetum coccineum]